VQATKKDGVMKSGRYPRWIRMRAVSVPYALTVAVILTDAILSSANDFKALPRSVHTILSCFIRFIAADKSARVMPVPSPGPLKNYCLGKKIINL
jgi:hypothetical protein